MGTRIINLSGGDIHSMARQTCVYCDSTNRCTLWLRKHTQVVAQEMYASAQKCNRNTTQTRFVAQNRSVKNATYHKNAVKNILQRKNVKKKHLAA